MKEKLEKSIGLVYTAVEAFCRLVLIFMVCTVTAQVISGILCLVMVIAKFFGMFRTKSTDEFLASGKDA